MTPLDLLRHGRGRATLRVCLLACVFGIGLAAPRVAAAHGRPGALATDFEARVAGFRPAAAGLEARVLDGDQRVRLQVKGARVVVVLGLIGEPFLRFSRSGVEANLASPTASSTRVVASGDAVASAQPRWRRIRSGRTFAWHDNRLRPRPTVAAASTQPREVATWSIPLLVDGRRTELVGSEWYARGPSLWPWLLAGTFLVALAGAAACTLPMRVRGWIAAVLLPVAVGACAESWLAASLAGRSTAVIVLAASVFAAATLFLLVGVMIATRGRDRLAVMALVGAFAAAFTLPEASIFGHGFVFSAFDPLTARLVVATAIVGGVAVTAVCLPAVIDLLGLKPPQWP